MKHLTHYQALPWGFMGCSSPEHVVELLPVGALGRWNSSLQGLPRRGGVKWVRVERWVPVPGTMECHSESFGCRDGDGESEMRAFGLL